MIALDIDRLRRAFPTRTIDYHESIDSTMPPPPAFLVGDVVLAEEQTAGQGRHGHSWHSAAGDGIYCSLVLPQSPLLTLALGLATHTAIFEATGLLCDLRWPNDLMLGDKKVAGILVQAAGRNAIAGIGINVNHAEFPAERGLARHFPADRRRPVPPSRRHPAGAAARNRRHRPAGEIRDPRILHASFQLRFRPPRRGAPARRNPRRHHRWPQLRRIPDRAPATTEPIL
jgi:hypothetical protein